MSVRQQANKLKFSMLDDIRKTVDNKILTSDEKVELIQAVYKRGEEDWRGYMNIRGGRKYE